MASQLKVSLAWVSIKFHDRICTNYQRFQLCRIWSHILDNFGKSTNASRNIRKLSQTIWICSKDTEIKIKAKIKIRDIRWGVQDSCTIAALI